MNRTEEKINIGFAKDIIEALGFVGEGEMSEEEINDILYLNICKNTYHTLCCKSLTHSPEICDFYEKKGSKEQVKWKDFAKEEARKYNLSFEELSQSLRRCLNSLTNLSENDQDILYTILNHKKERAQVRPIAVSDSSSEVSSSLAEVPDSLLSVPDPS